MAGIYKYAAITIVPTAPTSCHDGFLYPRLFRRARIPYYHTKKGVADGHVLLQLTDYASNHYEQDVETSWWNLRGWTLQERLLSRRILYFCPDRFYFECKIAELVRTEGDARMGLQSYMSSFNMESLASHTDKQHQLDLDGNHPQRAAPLQLVVPYGENTSSKRADVGAMGLTEDSTPLATSDDDDDNDDKDDNDDNDTSLRFDHDDEYSPFVKWYSSIQIYSNRYLTYGADKFPAAEGLARDVAANCDVGRYLAGLWENDLALGLLWRPVPDWHNDFSPLPWSWPPSHSGNQLYISRCTRLIMPIIRLTTYRAPSWSWASLDGRIHWPQFPNNEVGDLCVGYIELLNGEIELLDVHLQLEGESAFGRLTGGYLILRGKYQMVKVSGPVNLTDRSPDPRRLPRHPNRSDVVSSHFDDFVYSLHSDAGHFAYAAFDMGVQPTSGDVYALKTINQPSGSAAKGLYSGILLQETEEAAGAFRRVGVFVLVEDHLDAFANVSPEPITLV